MKITTKSRYGLRAIGIIAENFEKGPTPVSVIARKEGIDVLYLEQLLNRLKKAGFLKSVRGPRGGYVLSCDPGDIAIYDLVSTLEGDLSVVSCLSDGKGPCFKERNCRTRGLWKGLNKEIKKYLGSFSLKDVYGKVR